MNTDIALFLQLNDALSGSIATRFFAVVTYLGNGLILAFIVLPLLYLLKRGVFKTHTLPLVLAVALSGAAVNILKPIVDRPRPGTYFADTATTVSIPNGTPPDKAFPSGHTQTAFGTAVYLSLLFPALSPLFIGLATLVGLSRIALGVHFPADVLVGALFGALFSIAAHRIALKRCIARRRCRIRRSRQKGETSA